MGMKLVCTWNLFYEEYLHLHQAYQSHKTLEKLFEDLYIVDYWDIT